MFFNKGGTFKVSWLWFTWFCKPSRKKWYFFFLFFNFYFYFILLYNTVLVLPYIDMNPPWVYMSFQSWTALPPHIISLDHPRAPAPSILHPVSNIDWLFVSYMIGYMFQCHSPKSPHPLPLPLSPKVHSKHLCLLSGVYAAVKQSI